jgi:hypothetical protein
LPMHGCTAGMQNGTPLEHLSVSTNINQTPQTYS